MKNLINVLTLLFLSSVVNAQINVASPAVTAPAKHIYNNGYLLLGAGVAFPTGEFSDEDLEDDESGFAELGKSFHFEFGYRIIGKLGAAIQLRHMNHPFEYGFLLFDESFKTETTPWKNTAVLTGPYFSVPISKASTFDIRAGFGMSSVTSPELRMSVEYLGDEIWIKQHSKTSSAFAMNFSAGFKIGLSKRFSLLTQMDYFITNPEFKNVQLTNSDNEYAIAKFRQSISVYSLNLGLVFKI